MKNRCSICNIKIGLDYYTCSCNSEFKFCSTHRFPFEHNCSKDCKQENKKELEKQNPIVKCKKIEVI